MLNRFLPWKKANPGYLPATRIGRAYTPGLISVVLPVYNGAPYLHEAIDSVLGQTYSDWELLIVDDGSTDGSGEIAAAYTKKDRRIRLISQENKKLPRALNNGFREARGEFFTWISADNRMLPQCLFIMADELLASPDTDMVFGNMYLIDAAGQRLTRHGWFEFPPTSGNVIFPSSTTMLNTVANNTIGAAFLYRGSVDGVLGGYSPRQFMLEDYDYFMRLNSLFHIRHTQTKEPIYSYRMHPDSLTAHDEDLGITASRPKLMAFDAHRRACYPIPLSVWAEGWDASLTSSLNHAGIRILKTRKEADQFSLQHPERFFCLQITPHNAPHDYPAAPWYLLDQTTGYHLSLQRSNGEPGYGHGIDGPFSFSSLEDLALFLRLRAVCDLLWKKEQTF